MQCDHADCLKWRLVPDLPGVLPKDDEPWFCEFNRDPARITCAAPQQPDDAVLPPSPLLPDAVLPPQPPPPMPPSPSLPEPPPSAFQRPQRRKRNFSPDVSRDGG